MNCSGGSGTHPSQRTMDRSQARARGMGGKMRRRRHNWSEKEAQLERDYEESKKEGFQVADTMSLWNG